MPNPRFNGGKPSAKVGGTRVNAEAALSLEERESVPPTLALGLRAMLIGKALLFFVRLPQCFKNQHRPFLFSHKANEERKGLCRLSNARVFD